MNPFADLESEPRSSVRQGYAGPRSHLVHRPLGAKRTELLWTPVPPPLTEQVRLRTAPVSQSTYRAGVRCWHRHLWPGPVERARFGVYSRHDGVLRGVAAIGNPKARLLGNGTGVLEVLRVATDGTPNTCSALYGACIRWARARGWDAVITYILRSEPGTSLRAAGFALDEEDVGGGQWDREGRSRAERSGEVEKPKSRWIWRAA